MEPINLSRIWPEWQVVRQLGKGSYGTVYEAVRNDQSFQSRAAIKVLRIPQNESELSTLRAEGMSVDASMTYFQGIVNDFIDEIRLMESFKGVQNIVSVEDYKVVQRTDRIGWEIYIRMELLTPFNEYIVNHPLSEWEVIKLGVDMCKALELCEKRHVIHRDIKPENIFINQFGDFKLGDFGIARTLENKTSGLSQKGTYNYMAPEIERGGRYDATVDIYSLGIVLYRLVNQNRLPFLFNDQQMLSPGERNNAIRRRMNGEALPYPAAASQEMANVVLCATQFDPRYRFQTPGAFKQALLAVGTGAKQAFAPGNMAGGQETGNETWVMRQPGNQNGPGGQYGPGSQGGPGGQYGPGGQSGSSGGNNDSGSNRTLKIIIAGLAAIFVVIVGTILGLSMSSGSKTKADSTAENKPRVTAGPTATPTPEEAKTTTTTPTPAENLVPNNDDEDRTWQDAYIEYLNDCYRDNNLEGFMLLDMDEDEIPELLLYYSDHSSMGLVAWHNDRTYENGLGDYCSTVDKVSGITFYPKSHTIYSQSISPSKTEAALLYDLQDGKLVRVDSVTTKKGAVNYTLADSYSASPEKFEKEVSSWTPKSAFAGTKPVTTATPTATTATPKPDKQPSQGATILYLADPDKGMNLRAGSDYNTGKLLEVHGRIPITFRGEVEQGYGSDGKIHDWYKVEVSPIYGWVRCDMVTDTGNGYLIPDITDGMNVRTEATYNSGLAACIYGGAHLVYQGSMTTGYGSDGQIHDWMYISIEYPLTGWMRGDLLTTG